jgi:hypothetical protein
MTQVMNPETYKEVDMGPPREQPDIGVEDGQSNPPKTGFCSQVFEFVPEKIPPGLEKILSMLPIKSCLSSFDSSKISLLKPA